jgi:glucose-6-phosphate isomerase
LIISEKYLEKFIFKKDYERAVADILNARELLEKRLCAGSEMLGWLDCIDFSVKKIKKAAEKIRASSDAVLILGIGGSWLGAKMAIDFLKPCSFPKIFFLGNDILAEPILDAFSFCRDKNVTVIIVSKSGSTLEIRAALEFTADFMKKKYSSEANKRIIAVTGKSGKLRERAENENWKIFEIPENIGGRFSVLCAAGLLPIAVSGANIEKIMAGARLANKESGLEKNIFVKYAAMRTYFYRKNYSIEILAGFDKRLNGLLEWWKQLFGESEGKDGKGLFPASVTFSSDLHSLGQFIQEGPRILFETFLFHENPPADAVIPGNDDLVSGKTFYFLNSKIFEGTAEAHYEGGVPCIILKFKDFGEFELGYMIYFFKKSCALSAIALGVNPFDQPGVENYKIRTKYLLENL